MDDFSSAGPSILEPKQPLYRFREFRNMVIFHLIRLSHDLVDYLPHNGKSFSHPRTGSHLVVLGPNNSYPESHS